MRILIEPGSYSGRNLGDVAMLQVAVKRLQTLWPDASIEVITEAPQRVLALCPGIKPVPASGRRFWFTDGFLVGPCHRVLPPAASRRMLELARRLRRSHPRLVESVLRSEMRLLGLDGEDLNAFLEAVHSADLVVVSGQGSLTDAFGGNALDVLDLLGLAHQIGTPTALFSQGVGPVEDPRLRKRMIAVLPCVELIALREGRSGPGLLRSLQVSAERVRTTGDDAIELAYGARPERLGSGLGLNLRVSDYSQVGTCLLEGVRAVLPGVRKRYGAPVIPLPISVQEPTSDAGTLRQLLAGFDGATAEGPEPDTPLEVIEQAGRCRVVVTGSYHAAVFALSQGVPAVCLAKSAYYRQKFLGLAGQFGGGCEVITAEAPELPAQLDTAIDRAWSSAERVRSNLLEAAARQVESSWSAYCLVHEQIQARAATHPARSRRALTPTQAQADRMPQRREQSRSTLESADTFPH